MFEQGCSGRWNGIKLSSLLYKQLLPSIIDCSLCTCPIVQQNHEAFQVAMFVSSTTGGVFPNERKAVVTSGKEFPRLHCCLLAFSIKTGHGVAPCERMEIRKCFWNLRFQLAGDIMGCNITKMCASAKPDPKLIVSSP